MVDVLDLSGERDLHLALRLAAWRDGYRIGYQDGHARGYRTGYETAVMEWKIVGGGMTHLGGPTYAELDRRRYPPGGRLSWLIPRPGEDAGRQHG